MFLYLYPHTKNSYRYTHCETPPFLVHTRTHKYLYVRTHAFAEFYCPSTLLFDDCEMKLKRTSRKKMAEEKKEAKLVYSKYFLKRRAYNFSRSLLALLETTKFRYFTKTPSIHLVFYIFYLSILPSLTLVPLHLQQKRKNYQKSF